MCATRRRRRSESRDAGRLPSDAPRDNGHAQDCDDEKIFAHDEKIFAHLPRDKYLEDDLFRTKIAPGFIN